MSKNFNYLDYREKISGKILDNLSQEERKNIIFVFDDFQSKKEFLKENKFIFIDKNYEFLTFDELRDKIYITSHILIDRKIASILLYNSLSENLKKEMGVTDYFSMIDFSNRFFNFFKELYKNDIKNLERDFVYNWERDQVELIYKVRDEFNKTIEENGYYPSDWIIKIDNFDNTWIKKTEKIIFIDVVKFTNLDKKILEENLNYIDLDFYFQMKKDEFDEENLRIKNVEFPDIFKNIKLYNVIDDTIGAFNLANFLSQDEKENISTHVYSPLSEESIYYSIFPKFFQRPLQKQLEETKFYSFIKNQRLLLNSIVINKNNIGKSNLLFKIEGFIEGFNSSIFKEYYGLSTSVEKSFYRMVDRDYKYISKEILLGYFGMERAFQSSLYNSLVRIIDDIELVLNAESYEEIFESYKKIIFKKKYLNKIKYTNKTNDCDAEINFDKEDKNDVFDKDIIEENLNNPKYFLFYEEGYKNMIASLYEIFRETLLLSKREIFTKMIDDNFGLFTYKFLFDEMRKISYKIEKNEEDLYSIEDINIGKYLKKSNVDKINKGYFIDMISTAIPAMGKANIIFTENQLKDLGFITGEEKKNIEKYRFIQNICVFDELIFFSYTNDDEKIEYSTFIEELKLKYNLKEEKLYIYSDNYIKMLGRKFLSTKILKKNDENKDEKYNKVKENKEVNTEENEGENIYFKKDKSLLGNRLKLGAYTYTQLKKCNLQYYLDNIIGIEETAVMNKIEPITRLYLGNFFHEIMERIMEYKKDEIINNKNFYIDREYVVKTIENVMRRDMGKKIPYYFEKYYLEALIPKLVSNILRFFKDIKIRYEKVEIKNIEIEKSTLQDEVFMEKNNIEVILNGKVDLLITTADGYDIYDHKTGKPKEGQMDFYKIALFPESGSVKKLVYNGWDGELTEEKKDFVVGEEMEEEISRFIINDRLAMVEPNKNGNFPICKECIYKKICGRG